MGSRNSFYNSIDTILFSMFIALIISVIFALLVQFIPSRISIIIVVLSMIVLLIAIICLFTYKTDHIKTKIILGIFMLVILIFSLLTIFKHKSSLDLHSIYLKWSTKMVKDRILTLLYIPIFVIILAAFIFIIIL